MDEGKVHGVKENFDVASLFRPRATRVTFYKSVECDID